MVVTVKYVFGLARGADGRDTLRLDLPTGATVFEALRQLGLSALELHAAVNGESAADGTVLREGDEVILIPSIQGGRSGHGGMAMRRVAVVVGMLAGLGLAGPPVGPVAGQTRVVVPIVIRIPHAAPPSSSTPSSVQVTTRTLSPHPGVTTTRVTVRDARGAGRVLGVSPTAHTLGTVPVGTPSVLVTVDRPLGLDRTVAPGRTRVTVADVSQAGHVVGGPPSTSSQRAAGSGHVTWTIASEAPIDAPIVVLGD